jgi:hypothetical protein
MLVAGTSAFSMQIRSQSLALALVTALVACSSVGPANVDSHPAVVRSSSPRAALTLAPALTSAQTGEAASPAPGSPPDVETEADDRCAELGELHAETATEQEYSLRGYTTRTLRLERAGDGANTHCVLVAWPAGSQNTAGQRVNVAPRIHDSWFRLIENTLSRIPLHHAKLVRRLVIDDRPTEHGIAPFDRQSPGDARDGHTIWLHEHLFTDPNHWARGNHGSYWSYHVNEDGRTAHDAPDGHELFSPVLLHEIGHLVMYHLVNGAARGIDATAAPSCAHTCGETRSCATLGPLERERNCISPYCMPFRFPASTENWAEQYRFYFQSARTRELLSQADAKCLSLLHEHDHGVAPWLSGKPDIADFRPSRWASCGDKPCKGW